MLFGLDGDPDRRCRWTNGVGDEAPGDGVFVKYCALFVCEQAEKKVV